MELYDILIMMSKILKEKEETVEREREREEN